MPLGTLTSQVGLGRYVQDLRSKSGSLAMLAAIRRARACNLLRLRDRAN